MSGDTEFTYKYFRDEWNRLLEAQQYRNCEQLCHEGLSKQPGDKLRGKLYNHLGYLYENFLEDKTFDDILEHYVLSLQVDETNAAAHYNLANFLLEQGMQHLLRGLELNPRHSQAQKRLALLSPLKMNDVVHMGNVPYRCMDITETGVRCIRLDTGPDGKYVDSKDQNVIEIGRQDGVELNAATGGTTRGASPGATGTNTAGASNMQPMSIADAVQPNTDTQNGCCNGCKCCPRLAFSVWIWIICFILAVGGLGALGYGRWMAQNCETIVDTAATEAFVNSGGGGEMNVAFVADCTNETGNDNWSDQKDAMQVYLNELVSSNLSPINVAIIQSCNNETTVSRALSAYDSTTDTDIISSLTIESSVTPDDTFLWPALDACATIFDGEWTDTSADPPAFVCVPLIIDTTTDVFSSINIANDPDSLFQYIYLTPVTLPSIHFPDVEIALYTFLGSLGSIHGCSESDADTGSETALTNSWWELALDCGSADDDPQLSEYCPHCLFYTNDTDDTYYGDFECNLALITDEFETGVESFAYSFSSGEECETEMYWWYAAGAAIPLLICVFILIINICCVTCCAPKPGTTEARMASNLR